MARFEIIAECVIDNDIDLETVADEQGAEDERVFIAMNHGPDCDLLGNNSRVGSRLLEGFSLLLGCEG